MTRDEIREIAEIVGGDSTYKHFVHRINKEFELADSDRNANVFVKTCKADGKKVGFSVIGYSPAKMKVWNRVFREEGWVREDFEMNPTPFELMYMYVRPEYRRRGFGTKLFNEIASLARKKGVGEIYAYVSDESNRALEFYRKLKASIISDFSDGEVSTAFLRWSV